MQVNDADRKKENKDISTYLWARFISGDDYAYSQLYKLYVNEMFAYGTCFTSDRESIKDCIQNVFIRIYGNRDNLKQVDNIKLYLFIALKNGIYNTLKYTESHTSEDISNVSSQLVHSVEEVFIESEEQAHNKKIIEQILHTLTPHQREIIYYRYVEELSYDEICKRMNMNYQSVRNLLHRSIKKIRDTFPDYSALFLLSCIRLFFN